MAIMLLELLIKTFSLSVTQNQFYFKQMWKLKILPLKSCPEKVLQVN